MADQPLIEPEDILTSLTRVIAPSHGINIVDLGIVYGITCERSKVTITMTLPDREVPSTGLYQAIESTLKRRHPSLRTLEFDLTWDPPWHEGFITAEGELQMLAPIAPGDPESELAVEDVWNALRLVIDPELGINIVDLGLVYGVEVDARSVAVTYTLTTPGCPLHASIDSALRRVLETRYPGIEGITLDLVWDPAWDTDRISPEGRAQLRR